MAIPPGKEGLKAENYRAAAQGLKAPGADFLRSDFGAMKGAEFPLDPLAAADEEAREHNLTELRRRALMGDDLAGALVGNMAGTRAGGVGISSQTSAYEQMIINEQLAELRHRAEMLQLQIEQIDAEIRDVDKQIQESKERESAIDEVNEHYKQTGEYELNDKGELANEKAEDALCAYEKRTGEKVDRHDFAAIYQALRLQQLREQQEQKEFETRKSELEKNKEILQKDFDKTNAAMDKVKTAKTQEEVKVAMSGLTDKQKNTNAVSSILDDSNKQKIADIQDINLDDINALLATKDSKVLPEPNTQNATVNNAALIKPQNRMD